MCLYIGSCHDRACLYTPDAACYGGVEDVTRWFGSDSRLCEQCCGFSHLLLVGLASVGHIRQKSLCGYQRVSDHVVEEGLLARSTARLKCLQGLVDCADSGQRVGAHQAMVEVAHWQARNECVNPEREPSEL